jgi:transcriptional regulator with XRE-family HTH domain
MSPTKRVRSEDNVSGSDFVKVVERYLIEASWTKQQLMAAVKVGETQLYRWARGENIPTKALVNRIAAALAIRINERKLQQDASDLFNGSDRMDHILNNLLSAAGYSASVRGTGIDSCWEEIAKNRAWRLGYVDVPNWAVTPDRYGAKPVGKAIEYAEQVGRLLGLHTEWTRCRGWGDMNLAVMERRIHAIAPFILSLPERLFDYRFSVPCSETAFQIVAVISQMQLKEVGFLEDLPIKRTELLYVQEEIGNWAAEMFGDTYQKHSFQTLEEAVSYIASSEEAIYVFLSDSMTCRQLSERKDLRFLAVRTLESVRLFPSFAVHADEQRLVTTVDSVINMLPKIKEI